MSIRNINLYIIILLFASNSFAVEQDKVKHFAVSAVISSVTQHYTQNWKVSAVVCMSVGLAKELTDSTIDNKDLLADALGCSAGLLVYKSSSYVFRLRPRHNGAVAEISYKF